MEKYPTPKFPVIIGLLLFINLNATAQGYERNVRQPNASSFTWPEGKKMALSLTFDDARLSQIDKGIPLLNKYGVKGTFYLSPDLMDERVEGWKKAIIDGHDIGNHSMVHPCTGNFPWARERALEVIPLWTWVVSWMPLMIALKQSWA
jgi:peptidoglycan/xylan/chitin deacetylase (PgdA/CDA1 family)